MVVAAELLAVRVVDELDGPGDIVNHVAGVVGIWELDLCSSAFGVKSDRAARASSNRARRTVDRVTIMCLLRPANSALLRYLSAFARSQRASETINAPGYFFLNTGRIPREKMSL